MAVAQPSAGAATRRRTKKKSRLGPIIGGIAVVLIGWGVWAKTHPADNPMGKLITGKVTKGDLIETVQATGSISAQTGAKVNIGSQITGVIKRLYADIGTKVTKGQIIAELDLPDIKDQWDISKANLAASEQKLGQDVTTLGMQKATDAAALAQAQASEQNAEAQLRAAQAAQVQQTTQTPQDVRRAQTAVRVAQAALSTAQANQKQVQDGAQLQINTAKEQLAQAKANATNSSHMLQRNQALLTKGFVAQSVVDQALATDQVNQSLVTTAQQNESLVEQKVTDDLQSAADAVTQAQQNLDAARASLVTAQAETYSDAQKVAATNAARAAVNVAQANVRTALANMQQNVIKAQDVQQAQSAVNAGRAQVDYSAAQVAKTYIRSPIKGTVLQLAAQQGETLAAGFSAPTLIVVADLSRLEVDVYVDETDIGKVKLGQKADVTVDAFPHHTFHGHVFKIASGSTIQQGVVTYDVSIAIDDNDKRHENALKPDMTANVTIHTGVRHDVLLVPAEAVKVGVHGSTVNQLVMKDGKPTGDPVRVRTGASDGVNTEIVSGLKEGDTIVLAGMDSGRGFGPTSPFGPSTGRPAGAAGGAGGAAGGGGGGSRGGGGGGGGR
jgi:RND family efflux transporter MFP subunit